MKVSSKFQADVAMLRLPGDSSMNQIQLCEFKQQIAAIYNRRQDSYNRSGEDNWHFKLACSLVEYAAIKSG